MIDLNDEKKEEIQNIKDDDLNEIYLKVPSDGCTDDGTSKSNSTLNTSINRAQLTSNNSKTKGNFTKRFRSFSNDLIRTIELAHDFTDLHNSNFATATVQAAQNNDLKLDISQTTINTFKDVRELEADVYGYDDVDFKVKNQARTFDDIKNTSKTEIPDGIYISIWEVFIYLWGVIAFFIDLISDIILSVGYYGIKEKWLSFLTLLFVIVPNITLSLFSLSWYIDNYKNRNKKLTNRITTSFNEQFNKSIINKKSTLKAFCFWPISIIFLVLQLDLVLKYFQGFVFTLKGWVYRTFYNNIIWEKYYIEKQIKCDTDIGMLRLIDVFMDSGPQVLLQLYVITTQKLPSSRKDLIIKTDDLLSINVSDWSNFLAQENRLVLKQIISIASSLFSMAYALAGYHRCLRNQQFIFSLHSQKPLLKPISWWATIMQFLWYLFLIAPRVFAMALFCSTFRSWFFMIIFIHWLIMYSWILSFKTNYCITSINVYNAREEIFEKFYNFVCSFIYIFVYFNLIPGKTRFRYIVYYIIFYSENCLFSISYFLYSSESNFYFKLTSFLIILCGFWIALLFQIVYYLNFHPSLESKLFKSNKKNKEAKNKSDENSNNNNKNLIKVDTKPLKLNSINTFIDNCDNTPTSSYHSLEPSVYTSVKSLKKCSNSNLNECSISISNKMPDESNNETNPISKNLEYIITKETVL